MGKEAKDYLVQLGKSYWIDTDGLPAEASAAVDTFTHCSTHLNTYPDDELADQWSEKIAQAEIVFQQATGTSLSEINTLRMQLNSQQE